MRTVRVRTRTEFDALGQRGRRSRHRAVRVTYLPAEPDGSAAAGDAVRVAFAIGRPVGTAVVRNRLRRRLRAALAELSPPPGTYLVRADVTAVTLPYADLRAELAASLADVAGHS